MRTQKPTNPCSNTSHGAHFPSNPISSPAWQMSVQPRFPECEKCEKSIWRNPRCCCCCCWHIHPPVDSESLLRWNQLQENWAAKVPSTRREPATSCSLSTSLKWVFSSKKKNVWRKIVAWLLYDLLLEENFAPFFTTCMRIFRDFRLERQGGKRFYSVYSALGGKRWMVPFFGNVPFGRLFYSGRIWAILLKYIVQVSL